ncbi:MAG TPA: GDYXXLXY domain-containing protein [Fontimonas sp.]
MIGITPSRAVLLGLAVLCLVQWSIPLALIQRGQTALAQGTPYKFRTAPVDPSDPFRGRYVTLDFQAALVPSAQVEATLYEGQRGYASIRIDAQGFAQLHAVRATEPATGDYLPVTLQWKDHEQARLRLPFDRYYLDEAQAPQVEQRYRESNLRLGPDDVPAPDPRPTYATVRVLDGYAVLENLVLNGEAVAAEP